MSYGFPLTDLWDATLPELSLLFGGAQMRLTREHDERIHAVWMGAQFSAYAPTDPRKFPKLSPYLLGSAPKRQTPEQRLAAVEAWALAAKR